MVKSFAYKDANEALVAGDEIAIKEALNNAVTLRPDNIIHAPDLLQKVLEPENRFGLPFPWIGWNDYMNGLQARRGLPDCSWYWHRQEPVQPQHRSVLGQVRREGRLPGPGGELCCLP